MTYTKSSETVSQGLFEFEPVFVDGLSLATTVAGSFHSEQTNKRSPSRVCAKRRIDEDCIWNNSMGKPSSSTLTHAIAPEFEPKNRPSSVL